MAKVHGKGGHGRYFRELERARQHQEEMKAKIARAQEAKVRQMTDAAKREVEAIGEKFTQEVIPMLKQVRIKIEERARRGGIAPHAFVLRTLAIDEYAVREIKRRMTENEVIKPFADEINFDDYRPLSWTERSQLLQFAIGKKPSISKQRTTLAEIQRLSYEVPRWAVGTI
jgi:hypothetical protein